MDEQKSAYEVKTKLSEGILEVVITGEGTPQTSDAIRKDVLDAIKDYCPQAVVCDTCGYQAPRDIAEAYFHTRNLPYDIRVLLTAVVDSQADANYTSFCETTAANAGISVKWFSDIESARIWLKTILDKRKK